MIVMIMRNQDGIYGRKSIPYSASRFLVIRGRCRIDQYSVTTVAQIITFPELPLPKLKIENVSEGKVLVA